MSARARTIVIGVVAAIVMIGVWYFFLWSPAGKDLTKAKADRAAAEQQRDQLQARLTHLKKLQANQAQLEADRDKLQERIPNSDQLDQFILEVNDRATKAGVTFVSISPQQPAATAAGAPPGAGTAATAATPVVMQLQVTGDYFAILRFMEAMRDGPRLFTVDTLALSKGGQGPNELSASIGARMFVSKQASTPALPAPAQ